MSSQEKDTQELVKFPKSHQPRLSTVQKRFQQLVDFQAKFSAHNPQDYNFVRADMMHWHYEICLHSNPVTNEELRAIYDHLPNSANFIRESAGFTSLMQIMAGFKVFYICEDCGFPLNYHDHKKDGCANCGDCFPEGTRRRIELR